MNFTANSYAFPILSKLSDLEVDLAFYEQHTSQILRRQWRSNSTKTTLTYSCQDKKKLHCLFSLVYLIREDKSGVAWAHIVPDRTHQFHSHISKKKCCEIDFESMRRCFKVLEQEISTIILRNNSIVPIDIMERLILGDHLTETMKGLKNKYPTKFKKSLDNQTNKIKRKMKRKSTNNPSNRSSSFFSDQTFNFFTKNTNEGVKSGFDETKILFEEEDEKEIGSFNPIVLDQ